jgi:hypothetical protein
VSYDRDFQIDFAISPDDTAPGYCPYTHQVVNLHFSAYGLARKFKAEASRKVIDFKTNMAKVAERGPIEAGDIDRELRHEVNKALTSGEGPNSWILAFWEGVRSCTDLVTVLNQDPAIQQSVLNAAPASARP